MRLRLLPQPRMRRRLGLRWGQRMGIVPRTRTRPHPRQLPRTRTRLLVLVRLVSRPRTRLQPQTRTRTRLRPRWRILVRTRPRSRQPTGRRTGTVVLLGVLWCLLWWVLRRMVVLCLWCMSLRVLVLMWSFRLGLWGCFCWWGWGCGGVFVGGVGVVVASSLWVVRGWVCLGGGCGLGGGGCRGCCVGGVVLGEGVWGIGCWVGDGRRFSVGWGCLVVGLCNREVLCLVLSGYNCQGSVCGFPSGGGGSLGG